MTFSKLIAGTVPHHGKYSSRSGVAVRYLIAHHWAGTGRSGYGRLIDPNADVSANYIIMDGLTYGQVPEEHRAWTSGSWDADAPAITVEAQNSAGAPEWPLSPANYEAYIRLTADIASRYGWGYVNRTRVKGHREFSATACPGPWLWARLDDFVAKAHAILTGGKPIVTPPSGSNPSGKSVAELAQAVLRGEYGNGDERKRRLGANYDAVQAEVNRLLGQVAPVNQATTISALAQAVLRGEYGNGDERVRWLGANYNAVQAEVNRLLGLAAPANPNRLVDIDRLAQAVLRGEYGNGEERKHKLGANYAAVQDRVNALLSGNAKPTVSIDKIAREVYRGDWGNGADRVSKLRSAGYDPAVVQRRVNELFY